MSLNSLQDDMSRRAASMAAMAKRASNPQDIQAIQKSLIAGVQSGAIQPYVGIPLIQELTQKLTAAKTQMAQSMAGAGMQQAPQGAPIAQQVMQQAAQADQSQGLEALPSNLPQEYAGGGIIAFEDGGQVEHYVNEGYTGGTGESERRRAEQALANLRTFGLRQRQQDPQGYAAAEQENKQAQESLFNMERAITGGPAGAMGKSMGLPIPATALAPVDTTKPIADPFDPNTATRRSMFTDQNVPPAGSAPPAAPSIPGIGGGGDFKLPTLPTAAKLTDYNTLVGDLPAKTKSASEVAVKAAQAELEGFDKPGFEAREEKFSKREAAQDKDSAMGRALNLMSLGFGIAGSKERSLAGALGNEGRQGIQGLIQGEAANRAARDRLDDARDNFEQQKIQAKKGNYQAAQAAGKDAANDLRAGTQLTMQAAHFGNTDANQRLQIEQQGALGLAGLGLQKQQLAQTGSFQNRQLDAMEKRYAAMDKASQARLMQVRAGAVGKFMETQGPQLNMQLAKEYGPNWRTSTDPRSLQAQMLFKQAQNTYVMDALGQYDDRLSAKDSSEY